MHLNNYACRIATFVALASRPLRAQQAGGAVTMTGQVGGVATVSAAADAKVLKATRAFPRRTQALRDLSFYSRAGAAARH
jgi:hypothetical protein